MFDFSNLPVRLVDLRDLTWPDHDISLDHLAHPELRREIDDVPIQVELLIDGHYYVHDGRHRCLRAIARGEYEIKAHAYLKK